MPKPEIAREKATSVTEWKDRVRRAGLRSTGSRLAVLRVLERATRPMTHQEVSKQLEGTGFDHATVFRNLNDLTDAGILGRADLGDHVWRFEMRHGDIDHRGQHPHFICTSCGEVECLADKTVTVQPGAGAPRALKRKGFVVQLQGRCDNCEQQATV